MSKSSKISRRLEKRCFAIDGAEGIRISGPSVKYYALCEGLCCCYSGFVGVSATNNMEFFGHILRGMLLDKYKV